MSSCRIHHWSLVAIEADEGPNAVTCRECSTRYEVVPGSQWTGDPLDELCRQPHDFGHRWRIQFNANDGGPVGIECARCGLERAIVGADAPIHYDDEGPIHHEHDALHAEHN